MESTDNKGVHFVMADGVRIFFHLHAIEAIQCLPHSCTCFVIQSCRFNMQTCSLHHLKNVQRLSSVYAQGFSVEGQENIQEILSKQLYLCQFLCALSILRPGEI